MGILNEPELYNKGFLNLKTERESLADSQLAWAGSHQEYQKYSDESSTDGKSRINQTESPGEFDGREQGKRYPLEVKESIQACGRNKGLSRCSLLFLEEGPNPTSDPENKTRSGSAELKSQKTEDWISKAR